MRIGGALDLPCRGREAYRIALLCGAIPLLAGVSIFLLWWILRVDWLIGAGIATLYGGVALVAVGALLLVYAGWMAYRTTQRPRPLTWRGALACAALLLGNFPAAGAVIVAASVIATRYLVIVHNETGAALDEVLIFGGGCEKLLGPVPPGGSARASFWFESSGSLRMRAISGEVVREEALDTYVTSGLGGELSITLHPGTVELDWRLTGVGRSSE